MKGSFKAAQIDDGFAAYLTVQQPDGDLTVDLSLDGNLSFSAELTKNCPTTLYARNGKGGELVMNDVQSRPSTDGVIDLGELTLPNRNIQQTIESKAVDGKHWSALNTLVNSAGGFVLLDEDGKKFTDFTLSVQRNDLRDYCWLVLRLGNTVRESYFVGDKLTLHQVAEEDVHYRVLDAEITLRSKTDDAVDFPLAINAAAQMVFPEVRYSDYYVFDSAGKLVCDRPRSFRIYLDPGNYTVVGLEKNAFISSISSPTELEELGIPADNYLKYTVYLSAADVKNIFRVPKFSINTFTLTATADEQMMSNGLVPVYIQYYNQTLEQYDLDREWTISIVANNYGSHDATLPLEKLEGKYAYSTEGEIVRESVSHTDGGYQYEQLELTVRGASGSLCLYAEATGRTLTVKVDGTGVATNLELPHKSISMPAPDRSTSQESGKLHLYVQRSQSADTSYVGRVYVDNKLQTETTLKVNGTGENLLPYRLTRYSDGSASHTVRAEVWQKTGEDEERIWTSDEYSVLLLPNSENTSEPVKLSLRMFMSREDEDGHGNLQLVKNFYLQSGSYGKIVYTLYPNDFNANNTLKNDMVLDYQLTVTNPKLVRNGRVVLRIYSGSESDPTITDLILRLNPATNTFDGTLTLEGGSYGINDMPYGYDLRYYNEMEMSISMEQLAAEIAQRKEETSSDIPADSMIPTEPVDMEALEVYLQQLPMGDGENEFTEEEKQALRDLCIAHNEWCRSVEESRAAISEVLALTAGVGIDDWDALTAEDVLELMNASTGDVEIEALADGDTLLDSEYLLSNCYLNVKGKNGTNATNIYIHEFEYDNEGKTDVYLSAVDLDARIHISMGEPPRQSRQSRMTRALGIDNEPMDVALAIKNALQTLSKGVDVVIEATIPLLDHVAELAKEYGLADGRLSWEKFLDANLASVDNLEQVLKSGAAVNENADMITKSIQEAKQAMLSFKMSMHAQNAEGMLAAVQKLKGVEVLKKIPFGPIGTVVSMLLDTYETFRFIDENNREVKNCYTEIETANRYLSAFQGALNYSSSEECRDLLAGYADDCLEAVEDLRTDAEDIVRIQRARMLCRLQTMIADGLLVAINSVAPGQISLLADTVAFAVSNVSEAAALISLIKNMHEMEDDWEEIQENCIDPLKLASCNESSGSGGDGGDGGDGGGSGSGGSGGSGGNGSKPKIPAPTTPVIDPAGYVYEAVESNRVEGAEATIWYRDESGEAVAWDEAPEYGEVTTQTTGSDGRFSWMTPSGKWRVTVSKTGYANADSSADPAADGGWLPVPPPQLNVNIALVSESAPTVESAQAAADVIRVVFSRYMDTAQFANGALLTVTQSGEPVTVSVSFADSEVSPTDAAVYYGRVLELRRTDGESFADSVSLTVDRAAKNYAGTAMAETYSSGSLSVQPIPGSIVHSYPNRFVTEVGEEGTLAVQVLDTTGKPLAGVTVTAAQQTGGTLELAETAVSDSNGRAVFAVKGLTSGYDVITFSAGTVRETMNTRVAPLSTTAPKKPTANLTDYQVVSAGTQLVITAQQGTTIRYTTNNTCPCTEEALTYTAPITLSDAGEYFFRIAAWTRAGGYSERLNLHITVQPGSGGSSGNGGSGSSNGTKPAEQPAQELRFADVPADTYYYEAVLWAVKNGITTGINETEFGPELGCTRAQIVTFLWRAAGCPEPKSMSSFDDVPADSFYAKAVAWAVENNITSGIGDGKFAPDEICTRAQSATFLYRAAGSPAVSGSAAFSDVGTDTFYANAVAWAEANGITGGIGDGLFGSELECTRAQIVTFLYRSSVK